MQEFSLEVTPIDSKDVIVIKPKGSIDSTSTPTLENRFKSIIDDNPCRIVLDLSDTDFISSAGLGLMLGTVATLRDSGGDLILMNVSEEIADTFQLMRIDDYFRSIERLDELTKSPV